MREHTVKSILTVISKLSDRTINGELLKYLAKTANDEQPGIRTNTTICLGKIARNLGVGTRSKVLVAAFSRSLRDPFIHARNAALMALAATVDIFNEDDSANRIMPAICPLLLDKEKVVRDQANKVLDLYLAKVRKSVLCVADTGLGSLESSTTTGPPIGTLLPKEAASWAGWAISSFTNKISAAAGEIQSTTNGGPQNLEVRSNLAPQPGGLRPSHPTTTPASTIHRQIVASPSGSWNVGCIKP
jgi:SCY1-like protein 1